MERPLPARRRRRSAVVALLPALLPALLLAGCGDDDGDDAGSDETASDDTGPSAETTTTAADDGTASTTAAAGGTDVSIVEYAFSPTPLTVAVGDTVTWTNEDGFDHTSTADEGDLWDSGPIAPGSTHEFTFDEAGTYAYHCDIHNFMKGEIVVE
jgi:plastocyanin